MGYPPFHHDQIHDVEKLFRAICYGYYFFDAPFWDDISDEAKDFVSRMLTVNPAKRYYIRFSHAIVSISLYACNDRLLQFGHPSFILCFVYYTNNITKSLDVPCDSHKDILVDK